MHVLLGRDSLKILTWCGVYSQTGFTLSSIRSSPFHPLSNKIMEIKYKLHHTQSVNGLALAFHPRVSSATPLKKEPFVCARRVAAALSVFFFCLYSNMYINIPLLLPKHKNVIPAALGEMSYVNVFRSAGHLVDSLCILPFTSLNIYHVFMFIYQFN